MKSIKPINEFFRSKTYAVVGISAKKKHFGNYVFKQLQERNFSLVPVHPSLTSFQEIECRNSVSDATKQKNIDAAVVLVSKENSFKAVNECIEAGIKNIWLQQGSETPETIETAKRQGVNLIYGECIIMFLHNPGFGHKLHRTINKVFGLYPK